MIAEVPSGLDLLSNVWGTVECNTQYRRTVHIYIQYVLASLLM